MKKLIIAVAVVMAGVLGIYQANNNNVQMSELQLENAELLAQGEDMDCDYGGPCYVNYNRHKCKKNGTGHSCTCGQKIYYPF